MSYNLMVEGDLDLFELSRLAGDYAVLELFPIPAWGPDRDALGIAIPRSRANEDTYHALRSLITQLWAKNATVHDLMVGCSLTTEADLADLRNRLIGN